MWLQLEDSQMTAIESALAYRISELKQAHDTLMAGGQNKDYLDRNEAKRKELQSILDAFGEKREAQKGEEVALYKAAASEHHHEDGECEIDDDAIVSLGADPGAYVMAWVWVTGKQAGVSTKEEESE